MRKFLALPLWLLVFPLTAQGEVETRNLLELPTEAQRLLPDPAALISRVMARAKTVTQLTEAYSYREEQTEQTLDRKGNPTKSTVSVFDVINFPGGKVRRLLEVDGKPLSPEQAQAEETKIQTNLKEIQKIRPELSSPKKESEINFSVEDLLAVSEIGPISRTEHKGHLVLALSFRPNKSVSPKGSGQRLAAKLEGRVLVDEATDQVVWAEGRLTGSFWVGAGLLGALLPPSTFVFEQQRITEGLWMPVHGIFSLYVRIFFVPVRRRMIFHCSDFHRFVVEVSTLPKAPLPGATQDLALEVQTKPAN